MVGKYPIRGLQLMQPVFLSGVFLMGLPVQRQTPCSSGNERCDGRGQPALDGGERQQSNRGNHPRIDGAITSRKKVLISAFWRLVAVGRWAMRCSLTAWAPRSGT